MTWLYILACIAAWGAAAVLMKVTATHVGPFTSVVGNALGSAVIAMTILPRAQLSLTWPFAAAVIVGILFPLGNFCFYRLTQTGDVSRFAPVTALYVIVPIICGVWLLGETLTGRKIAGVALALAALWLLNSE
jgi:bacterial/archaeal transporter family protein